MPGIELVVIGASAGGLQAIIDIVEGLPETLEPAIVAVIHTRSDRESLLPQILARSSAVPVAFASNGAPLRRGHIYIAPPDAHVLVGPGALRLHHGPRENGFRPAVDPLFRTAARSYGSRVMGVVLSGALDDGTYGLKVVKDAGGVTVVQDPDDAAFASMPLSALRYVDVDHVVPAAKIADLILSLAGSAVEGGKAMARQKEPEPQNPAEETDVQQMEETFGPPSGLTCPDCGGALWEITNGELARYRCHVGHQFTTEGLDAQQQDAVESALWSAVRVLEEHSELRSRMAGRAQMAGMAAVSSGFSQSATDSKRQADTIRELLLSREMPESETPAPTSRPKRQRRETATKSVNGKGRRPRRRMR